VLLSKYHPSQKGQALDSILEEVWHEFSFQTKLFQEYIILLRDKLENHE